MNRREFELVYDGTRFPTDEVHNVAAVLFLAADRPGFTLVGVRHPMSRRHPGVLSIPTIRIPGGWIDSVVVGDSMKMSNSPAPTFGRDRSTESVEGAIVEMAVAKKLASGDVLNGTLFGTCEAMLLMTDYVDDPSGEDGSIELTRMLTVVAECESGSELLTGSTGSYEDLTWVSFEDLAKAWITKDGQWLFPQRLSPDICVRGLCLKSAIRLIESDRV